MQADVIVIGAGAAGLMAAYELSAAGKNVHVLEARDRIGGRAHTLFDPAFTQPVETGAEFVHGNLALTRDLLRQANLHTVPATGSVWRSNKGHLFQQDDFIEDADVLMDVLQKQTTETSIGQFLRTHFNSESYAELRKSIRSYVEGYYAGELDRASVLSLKEEWQQDEQPQHRVQGGYSALMHYLHERSNEQGAYFHFHTIVKEVTWAFEKVVVTTAAGERFEGKKLISTLPIALLQTRNETAAIRFQPEPAQHLAALDKLGYGGVLKFLIEFKSAFWKEQHNIRDLSFLFSEEVVPTWWTQHPQQSALLVGWCAGPNTNALKRESNAQLFQKAMQSLAHCFNLPVAELEQNVRAWHVSNWVADPFTAGGYSYITTTTKEALHVLLQPVEDTLYFAGEALYDDINVGTVEAALQSGKRAARQLLDSSRS